MFTRHSFVAITTFDLARARRFWVDQLGFRVIEEKSGEFFMVDAGEFVYASTMRPPSS